MYPGLGVLSRFLQLFCKTSSETIRGEIKYNPVQKVEKYWKSSTGKRVKEIML